MRPIRAAFSLLIAALTADTYSAQRIPSLCEPGEGVVFSCGQAGKVISLCASADLSSSAGYLQYRYGKQGRRPQLAYPEKDVHPSKAFHAWGEGAAKWSIDRLLFSIGEYQYVVFMQRASFDSNGGGVIVNRSGTKISQLVCARNRVMDNLYGLGKFGVEKPAADLLRHPPDVSEALQAAGL